jgi:hypothetical protein
MPNITRPLANVYADVAQLKADPVGTLNCGPVVIVDRPIMGLIGVAVAVGITYVVPMPTHRFIFMAVIVAIPFYLILFSRRLTFDSHGLEYSFGRYSAAFPWSAFIPEFGCGLHYDLLNLAIRRESVETVEHRRDGVTIGYGVLTSSYHLEVKADGGVRFRLPMSAERRELGGLILRVARSMQPSPAGSQSR